MDVYVARPAAAGPFSGVIVAGELFGLSAHVRDVCERLAELGYLALAPDLYHRSAPGIELAHDGAGRDRGFDLLRAMTRSQALSDLRASRPVPCGWGELTGAPRLRAMGRRSSKAGARDCYSDIPAASRASSGSEYTSIRACLPSRSVQT